MKAALIVPHATRNGPPSLLFESYCSIMIFEFCVGVFSVCEGLGSVLWLDSQNNNGSANPKVTRQQWGGALVSKADPTGQKHLGDKIQVVQTVRDKIHQDQIGARLAIDWHTFGYDNAFVPAIETIRTLLAVNAAAVPEDTNLD